MGFLTLDLDGSLAHHAVGLGEDAAESVPAGVDLGLVGGVLVGDKGGHGRLRFRM